MKVAILQGSEQLSKQLMRSLLAHQIKGDLITRIDQRTIVTYDFLVISSDIKPKVPIRVLEQVVMQKQCVLVYIHQKVNINQFYNLLEDPYFLLVPYIQVVELLPGLLMTVNRWRKEVGILRRELQASEKKLHETTATTKAKRILMTKGFSEKEAHNWIQKEAMDKRCKKMDVVNLIIRENIDI